jgi:hypothetical protein
MFRAPTLFALVIAWLILPSPALAWGPLTHVHFGSDVLNHLAVLTPFAAKLLRDHRLDYLYGCIAADHIVGKNLAPYYAHCHNWKVAFKLLKDAWTPGQKACAYGFLSHLAADVIAHNFYVPFKMVQSFPARSAKHTYWELRFDQFVEPGTWLVAKEVARHDNRENDALLAASLSKTLFSYRTGKRLFASALLFTRLKRWRSMMAYIGRRSKWPLVPDEVDRIKRMTIDNVLSILIDVEEARCVAGDPVGARNLKISEQLRHRLKALRRAKKLVADPTPVIAEVFEASFRSSIYATFEAPDLAPILAEPKTPG